MKIRILYSLGSRLMHNGIKIYTNGNSTLEDNTTCKRLWNISVEKRWLKGRKSEEWFC